VNTVNSEGLKGMYRGYTVSLTVIPIFNTLYFPSYEYVKAKMKEDFGFDKNDTSLYSISAGIAGTCCSVVTNPLWLVRTRMQLEIFKNDCDIHYRQKYGQGALSMFKIIKDITKNEGVLALWKGLPPTLLGIVHPLVFFPLYEKLKIYFQTNLEDKNAHKLSTKYIVASTLISKIAASAVSYPHEVLRSRIQYKVRERTSQELKESISSMIRRII
jgi:solute carrier family 25 (mitochondrial folate transporter), member 32